MSKLESLLAEIRSLSLPSDRSRLVELLSQSLELLLVDDRTIASTYDLEELGRIFQQLPGGIIDNNLDIAIKLHEAALASYDPQTPPDKLASALINLGNIHIEQWKIGQEESVENAIRYFSAAVNFINRQDFPDQWAYAQFRLGFAYNILQRGDERENRNNAIDHYNLALSYYTREGTPKVWASIHLNLGITYLRREDSFREENIKRSIELLESALSIFDQEESPDEMAQALVSLGFIYANLEWRSRKENIESAIRYLEAAHNIYQRRDAYWERIETLYFLGHLYLQRLSGDPTENVERAIQDYNAALNLHLNIGNRSGEAYTLSQLGDAYLKRGYGDTTANVSRAIVYFHKARKILQEIGEYQSHNILGEKIATLLKQESYNAFAVARIKDHPVNRPFFLDKEYILQAGLLSKIPEGFTGTVVSLPADQESIEIEVVVHAEDMDIQPAWMQSLTFTQGEESPLLEFRLRPHKDGHKLIRVEFLYQRHWLANIQLEIDVIEVKEAVLTP
jgi:tetratricopeptide (TPR) repeat protein